MPKDKRKRDGELVDPMDRGRVLESPHYVDPRPYIRLAAAVVQKAQDDWRLFGEDHSVGRAGRHFVREVKAGRGPEWIQLALAAAVGERR